jgi:hypothetical protein
MRRALVATAIAIWPLLAIASPWTVNGEAGAELDTNVQRVERVETGSGSDTAPVLSPVIRFGARADKHGTLLGGTYAFELSDLTRFALAPSVWRTEAVTLLGGNLRWVHPLGDRPVALGFGLFALDDFGLADQYGARTFRNLGADVLFTAHDGDDRHFMLAFGMRDFAYKPPTEPLHLYDYYGPAASARMDFTLWQTADHTHSLDLVTTAAFEARTYSVFAYADACPPSEARNDPECQAATTIARHDRAARAGAELTYSGREILQLGYQLELIDSNSFGNSFVRHRIMASATFGVEKVYISLLAILQLDQYPDGLLLAEVLTNQSFTSIEDENRSSAQIHATRAVSKHWSVEARAAYWRNIGNTHDLSFSRGVVYAGVTCSY